jgi:uncharacterized coiled-coil DUF342 family protein
MNIYQTLDRASSLRKEADDLRREADDLQHRAEELEREAVGVAADDIITIETLVNVIRKVGSAKR